MTLLRSHPILKEHVSAITSVRVGISEVSFPFLSASQAEVQFPFLSAQSYKEQESHEIPTST